MAARRALLPLLLAASLLLLGACSNTITPTPTTGTRFTIVFTPPDGVDDMKSLIQAGGAYYATFRQVGGAPGGVLAAYLLPATVDEDTITLAPASALPLDGPAGGIAARSGVLFVGTEARTVALSLADPAQPTVIDTVSLPPGINGVRISGTRMLLCDGGGLSLWDVTDPYKPVRTHALAADCWTGDVLGDRMVLGGQATGGFLVFDVARPDTFTVYPGAVVPLAPARPLQVRLVDDFLYVLLGNAGGVDSCVVDTWDLTTLDDDSTAVLVDSDPVGRGAAVLEAAADRVIVADASLVHVFRRGSDGTLAEDFAVPSTVGQATPLPCTGVLTDRAAVVPGFARGLMFGFY